MAFLTRARAHVCVFCYGHAPYGYGPLPCARQRYDSACVVARCFRAPKCVFGSSPYSSTSYAIRSATSDSSVIFCATLRPVQLGHPPC